MGPTATGAIVFAFTLAGMLLGMWLRNHLPPRHLDNDTQSSVKEVNGLIATMTALVLGLVTASAPDSFTKVGAAVEHTAADVVALDRLLARYGPETVDIRKTLQRVVEYRINAVWVDEPGATLAQIDSDPAVEFERIGTLISNLNAQSGNQQWLKSRALESTESMLAARWDIFAPRIGNAERVSDHHNVLACCRLRDFSDSRTRQSVRGADRGVGRSHEGCTRAPWSMKPLQP